MSSVENGLTPTERISLIGDEWAQFRANKATTGDYLNLVAAVKDDPNAQVVGAALTGINSIFSQVAATLEEKAGLAAWIRSTFGPVYARPRRRLRTTTRPMRGNCARKCLACSATTEKILRFWIRPG